MKAKILILVCVLLSAQSGSAITLEQLRQAAERGDLNALVNMAYIYRNGVNGVQQDKNEALKWYLRAAERGHANSQAYVGHAYLTGNGIEIDKRKAAMWLEKASAQGDTSAQFNLGVMYEQPLFSTGDEATGVPRSYEKAAGLYLAAAAKGHAKAQLNLATMYEKGIGVPQSDAKAFAWYLKAAENGLADAQMLVAYGYSSGAQKDAVRAYAWYNLAAALANDEGITSKKDAEVERDKIEKALTPQQLAEGQKLSAELFTKMPKK